MLQSMVEIPSMNTNYKTEIIMKEEKVEKNINYLEEISNYIFTCKYARYNEKLKRRETWEEAVERVLQMHLKKYSFLGKEDKDKIIWAFDLVKQKRNVPSMRSLQFGGPAIEAHNARIFNCSVRHIDSIRSFAETFYLLLCGCGVGIGLSRQFLNRLPDLVNEKDKTGSVITYTVQDTIEGWADSLEALLLCYFKNTAYTGRKIVFDYSKIRKKGEILKTGGGKAPGFRGLKNAHIKIKQLLDHIIEFKGQSRLKSINAYDIIMHSADAVLSGGIRRSATSTVFDKDDEDMLNAKTYFKVDRVFAFDEIGEETVGGFTSKIFEGKVSFEGQKIEVKVKEFELEKLRNEKLINWYHLFPQRGRSNNSILLKRNEVSKEEFDAIVKRTREFGEPGFVFTDDLKANFNPCFEINFIPITEDGVCGCQFCNLTSINGRMIDTYEKFKESTEASAIIGTLQAGYTNFPYLSNAAKKLTEAEALLGCSITGMMDNPKILLNEKYQKEMANLAKSVNIEWANKLNIKPAARVTCIKPEGTASLVLGTGSGIHPHHARKYIRRVQNNKIDNVYKFFKKHNKHMCEESVWSANKTDDVISFPIEVSENAMIKKDLTAIEHLEIIKKTQKNWVIEGTNQDVNKKDITHNVSCTVQVAENEWNEVIEYIYNNRKFFSAISLLPKSGDKLYQQAPMEEIVSDKDKEIWNDIIDKFVSVDYTKLSEEDDKTLLQQEVACAGGQCELIFN